MSATVVVTDKPGNAGDADLARAGERMTRGFRKAPPPSVLLCFAAPPSRHAAVAAAAVAAA